MGVTWQNERTATGEDVPPGRHGHAVAMWRQYDAMAAAIRCALAGESCMWEDADRHAEELADLIERRAWAKSVSHSIGEQVIQRAPADVRGSLRAYNRAVTTAAGRGRAPK